MKKIGGLILASMNFIIFSNTQFPYLWQECTPQCENSRNFSFKKLHPHFLKMPLKKNTQWHSHYHYLDVDLPKCKQHNTPFWKKYQLLPILGRRPGEQWKHGAESKVFTTWTEYLPFTKRELLSPKSPSWKGQVSFHSKSENSKLNLCRAITQ